jgi:hypothetical protein
MLHRVLIATICDKKLCPCPRCHISFDDIPNLGTPANKDIRCDTARHDNKLWKTAITKAWNLIYDDGYVVNSNHVEKLLKKFSLVPTQVCHWTADKSGVLLLMVLFYKNTFSACLGKLGFDIFSVLVVDLMHKFKLGV